MIKLKYNDRKIKVYISINYEIVKLKFNFRFFKTSILNYMRIKFNVLGRKDKKFNSKEYENRINIEKS